MGKFVRVKRRHLTLLEVLIAFLLIVIAAIPLLAPYPYIFKAEESFINEIEMDRLSALYYVDFIQKVYRREINPNEIEDEQEFPIEAKLPIPYTARYLASSCKVKVIFKPIKEGGEETVFTWGLPKVDG